jgi:hypothetical protein
MSDVGVVTGAEPYTGLKVMTLPDPGGRRIWEPDMVRLVIEHGCPRQHPPERPGR